MSIALDKVLKTESRPERTQKERLAGEIELLKQLYEPFPDEIVKQVPGAGGMKFDYIPGAEVILRLNKVLGMSWSFSIDKEQTQIVGDSQVIVVGHIRVDSPESDWISTGRQDFGTSDIRNKDYGNAFKAACTDCLKRCARQYGVALYLYQD